MSKDCQLQSRDPFLGELYSSFTQGGMTEGKGARRPAYADPFNQEFSTSGPKNAALAQSLPDSGNGPLDLRRIGLNRTAPL